MLGFNTIRGIRKETGLAFVWILLLLAMISALSVAFLNKVGIGTAATATRGAAMQAHYLARSAANHALWRLLNEPGFPASGTVYYMHDLGNGRYGYKVRKPTLTKFGTIATVGGVSDVVTKQSYVQYLKPYNIITAYGRSADQIPEYRRLLGATWVDAADTVDIGSEQAHWMVMKGCPKRKEIIMGTLDNAEDINLAVWNGESWGNLIEFTNNTGSTLYRSFDIAYENLSGDALVVGRYDDGTTIKFNIWNGTAWVFGTPQNAFSIIWGELSYITMASKPNSDEILIAAVNTNNDIKIIQWNGSAFNDLGVIDYNMETNDYGCAAIVYEQQSGTGVILWNHRESKRIYFRLWNGIFLSFTGVLPQFGQKPLVIRAGADPSSDTIFVAAVDNTEDLSVAVWDGDSWTDSREIFASVASKEGQVIDVAWEQSGGSVVTVWASSSDNRTVRYFNWPSGTSLSDHSVQTGPDFQNDIYKLQLQPISGSQKIILLGNTNGDQLRYSLWTGNRFLGDPAILLESSLASNELPFGIAESGDP